MSPKCFEPNAVSGLGYPPTLGAFLGAEKLLLPFRIVIRA
jgi:hypothetical protein